jgi:hypothetical protein
MQPNPPSRRRPDPAFTGLHMFLREVNARIQARKEAERKAATA